MRVENDAYETSVMFADRTCRTTCLAETENFVAMSKEPKWNN